MPRLPTDSINLEWCEVHKRWCPDGECWECHDDESQSEIKDLEKQVRDLDNEIYKSRKEELRRIVNMVKKTVKGELKNALELDPAFYLEELKKRLTEARLMVWEIVETKHFSGFKDAKNLVDAYDHLNKVISVFESYQLPLPGIDGKNTPAPDAYQTKLSIVEE